VYAVIRYIDYRYDIDIFSRCVGNVGVCACVCVCVCVCVSFFGEKLYTIK